METQQLSRKRADSVDKFLHLLFFVNRAFHVQVTGDGKLQVRLVRYNNPSGKGNNGHCCDGRLIFCEPRGCDYYFELCLDSFYG